MSRAWGTKIITVVTRKIYSLLGKYLLSNIFCVDLALLFAFGLGKTPFGLVMFVPGFNSLMK